MKTDVLCKWKPKSAGIIILTSGKINIKQEIVMVDKEGYNDKGLTHQETIIITNKNALNIKSPKYIKQIKNRSGPGWCGSVD